MIFSRLACLLRGVMFRLWITLFGGRVGPRVMVDRGAGLRGLPHKGIRIGAGLYLGRGVVLDLPRTGQFIVEDDVLIGHYSIVNATRRIRIGSDTLIAEHCSIRDADHGTAVTPATRRQPLVSDPVDIGPNVWIGRGAAVLRGSSIGEGAVIGANSVVKGQLQAYAVYVGSPAKRVRMR